MKNKIDKTKKNIFQKVIQFVKYHNAFTIGLILIFIFGGTIFASDTAREAVIGKAVVERSGIDNTILLSADMNNFNFAMKIKNVFEDNKNYYIDYSYQTLAIKGDVWQKVSKGDRLTVAKDFLGTRDLGLYAAEELGEVIDNQLVFLKKVQEKNKAQGETVIQETTKYTGLVGMVLNQKTKELPGYEVVMKPSESGVIVYNVPLVQTQVQEQIQVSEGSGEVLPETFIDTYPQPLTSSTDAVFGFHSSIGEATFQCQINNLGFGPCESPKGYFNLTAGAYTFEVYSVNARGKYDRTPAIFDWTIESAATTTPEELGSEESECVAGDESCEITICDPDGTLHLTGECQNTCIDNICQNCVPVCVCADDFSDCDDDIKKLTGSDPVK